MLQNAANEGTLYTSNLHKMRQEKCFKEAEKILTQAYFPSASRNVRLDKWTQTEN